MCVSDLSFHQGEDKVDLKVSHATLDLYLGAMCSSQGHGRSQEKHHHRDPLKVEDTTMDGREVRSKFSQEVANQLEEEQVKKLFVCNDVTLIN